MEKSMSGNGSWPPGYSIEEMPRTLAPDLIAPFREIPVAVAGACMGPSLGPVALTPFPQTLHPGLWGPGLTVQLLPVDKRMIIKAFLMTHPGDIFVIDGHQKH